MNHLYRVWRKSPSYGGPTFFISPPLSQYSRPWHSTTALRAKQSTGAASLTARKTVRKAFDHQARASRGTFNDFVTIKALENIGCQGGSSVLNMFCASAQGLMTRGYTPDPNVLWNEVNRFLVVVIQPLAKQEAGMEVYDTAVQDVQMLSTDPVLASEACYLCAHRLWNSQDLKHGGSEADWLPLAKWLLTAALRMGNFKAALDLAHVANLNPDGVIPPAALSEIRAAAMKHTDSRAMAVYARHLLNLRNAADQSTRQRAFELAIELSKVSEPADPSTAIQLTRTASHKWEAPWKLVRDAARQRLEIDYPSPLDPQHKEINKVFIVALREGVYQYNDPEAARDLSDHPELEEFSREWVLLKIKSAMDGHPKSCYDLGLYYIEYWGWYPCIGRIPSDNPEARIGLDWLELSAQGVLDDANEMHRRYLIVALLLRENGMHKEGREAVKRGVDAIENYSTDSRWRGGAVKRLQEFDRSWEFPFSARVEALLGSDATQKLPPEQRHKHLSGGESSGLMSWFSKGPKKKAAKKQEKEST